MKTFVLIASLFCFTLSSYAQPIVEVTNSTNCDLIVQLYSVNIKKCNGGSVLNVPLTSGNGISVPAPAGEEWIYAEISSDPYCQGGVSLPVGTPMSCSSTCSWGVPSNVTVTNNGCNGCLPNVNATWIDYCNHPGVLHITDF